MIRGLQYLPLRQVVYLALVFLCSACSTNLNIPDFDEIYTRSAMYHGIDRNPIIVIPGVLGSKLKDEASGKSIWGAFGGGYADPSVDEEMRLIALPIKEGIPLKELRDEVVSNGVLDQITVNLWALPVRVRAYIDIIGTLGAGRLP